MSYTKHLDCSFVGRIYTIDKGIEEQPICPNCGKKLRYVNMSMGFGKYCSRECNHRHERAKKKRDKFLYDKKDISLLTKEFIEENLLNKRGGFLTEKFRGYFHTEDLTIPYNIYHEVDYPKCEECGCIIDKIASFGEGYRRFCGVVCASNNEAIQRKTERNSITAKDYILPSGKIMRIQGYEHIYLDGYFSQGLSEDDISRGNGLGIFYEFEGKRRKYFPDFYIKSTNTVVEVKSTWTYEKEISKNIAKFKRTKEMGYNFELHAYKNIKGERADYDWENTQS